MTKEERKIAILTQKLEEATGKKVVLEEGKAGIIQEVNRIVSFAQILKESVSKIPSKYKPEAVIIKLRDAIDRLESKLEDEMV